MLLLTATTHKIQLITSSTAAIDVYGCYVDKNQSTGAISEGIQVTAITTATTTDVVAAPGSGVTRNLKTLHLRNKGAVSNDVTIVLDSNGTDYELHKVTLLAGDSLEYIEGVGFFTISGVVLLNRRLWVQSDVTNATTSFADVTGLTCPVQSGKHYNFFAHLIHISSGTTNGARFGVNGPTMNVVRISTIDTVTASVTASAHSAGTVEALDTAATAQTTGSAGQVLGILTGYFNPSASGTFAIRCAAETATANGLIVKAGSWMHIWEATG